MPAIGKKAPAFPLLNQAGAVVLGISPDPPGKLVDQHVKVSPKDSVARALAFLQGDA